MKGLAWLAVVASSVVVAGCGRTGIRGLLFGDSILAPAGEVDEGRLQVMNEVADRPSLLVAVELRDAATQAYVGELAMHLPPGASAEVGGVPEGTYDLVATFEDGLRTPLPPAQPLRLRIAANAAGAAAIAAFGHP